MHFYVHSYFYTIKKGEKKEQGSGIIKQLVKKEEYACGGIDLTVDSKINVWSNNLQKIDDIFVLVLNLLKEQNLILEGIEEHSRLRPMGFDRSKVILFAKNKDIFESLTMPKELMMGERVLTVGDEDVLNY